MLTAPIPLDKNSALANPGTGTIGPFREVGTYIRQWAQPDDYIWVNPKADISSLRYYVGRDDIRYRGFWGVMLPLGVPMTNPRNHVWFVLTNPVPAHSGAVTINYGHWRVVSQKHFDHVSVFELADGATSADEAYPDDIRFNAKSPTKNRAPPATMPASATAN